MVASLQEEIRRYIVSLPIGGLTSTSGVRADLETILRNAEYNEATSYSALSIENRVAHAGRVSLCGTE